MEKTIIDIGTKINLQDLVQSRLLIQANSGGGKTAICRTLIEESHGKIPFIIIDDAGEYYPLKEKFGDIVIIGGQFADVPISQQSVKMLPKFIISNQISVIIDISDLKSSQRETYLKDFFETMIDLPQQYWKPYLVFIEEAHKYCGEQDKQASAKAIKELMSGGRKKGYCGVLITQRIAKLHKDAAAECNNKFVGRTSLDIDMDRAAKELGFSASSEFSRLSLRDLKPGHFYAYGTSIEPHHVHEVTIRLPQTKLVKVGQIVDIQPKKPTKQMLEAMAKLNELPKDAAKELKDVKELQGEVIRLKTELTKAAKDGVTVLSKADDKTIERMKQQVSDKDEKIFQLTGQIKMKENENTQFRKLYDSSVKALDNVIAIALKIKDHQFPVVSKPSQNGTEITKIVSSSAPFVPKQRPIVSTGDGSLGKCSREVIRFLAQYPERQFSKAQVAIATGYSAGSGGFNNALSELNQKGFIIRSGKLQVNEDAIQEIVNCVGEIQHQDYDIETYKNNLGKCEREIYEVLLANPEQWYSKQELSQATETKYSADSGGFNNSLSRLNTLELIERQSGQIRLNQELLELMS